MSGITLKEFNRKVRGLELGNIVEKNTFNLVRDYLKGNILYEDDGYVPAAVDEEFITVNINEISQAIKMINHKEETKRVLNGKMNTVKDEFETFKDYDYLNTKGNLDRYEKKFFNESKNRIFYLILELRASLGLDLSEFYQEEVADYCKSIINDVVNNKYKRLNLASHLDHNGNIISSN